MANLTPYITLQNIRTFWNNLKSYVFFSGVCNTSANQRAKEVAVPAFSLRNGARVTVNFPVQNTANDGGTDGSYLTLNVNGTGAKRIYTSKGALLTDEYSKVLNGYCDFVYDGTNWVLVSFQDGDWNHIIYSTEAPTPNVAYATGTIWLKKKEIITDDDYDDEDDEEDDGVV